MDEVRERIRHAREHLKEKFHARTIGRLSIEAQRQRGAAAETNSGEDGNGHRRRNSTLDNGSTFSANSASSSSSASFFNRFRKNNKKAHKRQRKYSPQPGGALSGNGNFERRSYETESSFQDDRSSFSSFSSFTSASSESQFFERSGQRRPTNRGFEDRPDSNRSSSSTSAFFKRFARHGSEASNQPQETQNEYYQGSYPSPAQPRKRGFFRTSFKALGYFFGNKQQSSQKQGFETDDAQQPELTVVPQSEPIDFSLAPEFFTPIKEKKTKNKRKSLRGDKTPGPVEPVEAMPPLQPPQQLASKLPFPPGAMQVESTGIFPPSPGKHGLAPTPLGRPQFVTPPPSPPPGLGPPGYGLRRRFNTNFVVDNEPVQQGALPDV